MDRTPLAILAGDVGTGKTELAESFPDAVARDLGISMEGPSLVVASDGNELGLAHDYGPRARPLACALHLPIGVHVSKDLLPTPTRDSLLGGYPRNGYPAS